MLRLLNVPKNTSNTEVISRQEIVNWINRTLNFDYQKIEDLSSGCAYCLLMDLLIPGCLNVRKVKIDAKLEHEMLNNYKMMQNAFRKGGIEKDIPIMNLIKGRFQDHLIFAQWFKRLYDANTRRSEERKSASGDQITNHVNNNICTQITKKYDINNSMTDLIPKNNNPSQKHSSNALDNLYLQNYSLTKTQISPELIGLRSELNKLKEEAEEDQQTIADLTRERQFYYDKLCNIEMLCHEYENSQYSEVVAKVQEILFKEEEGFASPNNEDWIDQFNTK